MFLSLFEDVTLRILDMDFQTPPYDLLSSDLNDYGGGGERTTSGNNMTMADIIRIIDGILW